VKKYIAIGSYRGAKTVTTVPAEALAEAGQMNFIVHDCAE